MEEMGHKGLDSERYILSLARLLTSLSPLLSLSFPWSLPFTTTNQVAAPALVQGTHNLQFTSFRPA